MTEADIVKYMEEKYEAVQGWNAKAYTFCSDGQKFIVEHRPGRPPVVYGFIETIEEADQSAKKGKK